MSSEQEMTPSEISSRLDRLERVALYHHKLVKALSEWVKCLNDWVDMATDEIASLEPLKAQMQGVQDQVRHAQERISELQEDIHILDRVKETMKARTGIEPAQ